MHRLSGIALVVTLLAAASGRAQIMTNPVQDYINKTQLLNNILSNKRATDMSQKRQTGRASAPRAAGSPPSGNPAPSEPTKFQPSGAPVLPELLAGMSGGDAARQREAKQCFESLLSLYEQTARKDGFPSNDLAYAFEYFVVNSYMTYHDLHDVEYDKDPRVKRGTDPLDRLRILADKKAMKVTLTQERAVYDQFRELLAANDDVRAMTDRRKQEVAELLAIMLGMNIAVYMKGVNAEDEATVEQARQTARAGLEKLIGAPIDRIRIGDGGLEQ
jgi:hypothetical protein